MSRSDYWEQFNLEEWKDFADKWLAEIGGNTLTSESKVGETVVSMNFTASPEIQWQFILIAVSLAESDDELSHIAAGPIEHLLGWHGEDYISIVEKEVITNQKFARTLTGVWQYMMSDDVWSRVQTLKAQVSDPLRSSVEDI